MSEQSGLQEIICFILVWAMFAALVEALVELLLTAEPLEESRAWLARKSRFIAGLLSCGYCFSVWVAFPIAWILPSPMSLAINSGFSFTILDFNPLVFFETYLWWLVNGVILHRFSNIFHVKIAHQKLYDVVGEDDE